MAKKQNIKKTLVIGSGPIVIGQAAEFDYAGTQACKSLKEEGIEVVLVNSNPATIMTDKEIAHKIYIEPLTVETLEAIIKKEKPDSLLPTIGGQVGLNLAMELWEKGVLKKHNVSFIGSGPETITKAEDRQAFIKTMEKIGQPIAPGKVVKTLKDGVNFAEEIGYPLVLRPAYTLGGSGGGIAHSKEELLVILEKGLTLSRVGEVLVEKYIGGWKEVEYEVMRDENGTVISICNMENIDPVGVHTGDSIVVAPSQTLGDKEHQMLRTSSLKIIEELKICGACNVQFALHPHSFNYYVIEVNPRVSRSSALASKATGYPIAKVAAKIALGYQLDEIKNGITNSTYACFEPMLDYCVVKMPRLPFDKFPGAKRTLSTQMKATGEVMSIANNFPGAMMKALRSLEQSTSYLYLEEFDSIETDLLKKELCKSSDLRIFAIGEAIRRGISENNICKATGYDPWFIDGLASLIEMEVRLKKEGKFLSLSCLRKSKEMEFPDEVIGKLTGISKEKIKEIRKDNFIFPSYKIVDTCAGEFEAETPYYYSTYQGENEVIPTQKKKKVLVLGSGPIRIGQGIEFDYCCVHCVWALKEEGYETIIVNNNPETVSTDFDIGDKLYFEPLTEEDVENIISLEKPVGVVVQFGGQTAIKLTSHLKKLGVNILGTSGEDMDRAEDRKKFDKVLEESQIPRPEGRTIYSQREGIKVAQSLNFPLLVRPSYVLGGRGMEIVHCLKDVISYMKRIKLQGKEFPLLMDEYIFGMEVEVDGICDGKEVFLPGIMEHIEPTGVHSGDSISVYPTRNLSREIKNKIIKYTTKIALNLNVIGLINIQFIVRENQVYVIEVNPRSSRTVPYMSKMTGHPIIALGTKVMVGKSLKELGYQNGLGKEPDYFGVKKPVFSFEKIQNAEISLGPEMKSTGECLGISRSYDQALLKAFQGEGLFSPKTRKIFLSVSNKDKELIGKIGKGFYQLGYKIYATEKTGEALCKKGIPWTKVQKEEGNLSIETLLKEHTFDLVINTPTIGQSQESSGFISRRMAIETGVQCLTNLKTAEALLVALKEREKGILSLVEIGEMKKHLTEGL